MHLPDFSLIGMAAGVIFAPLVLLGTLFLVVRAIVGV
jgi:hypothetical protein